MKKREIILDFTSLLDVVMLLLFFFVIFSTLETMEQQASMQEQQANMQAEYEMLTAEAQARLSEANAVYDKASEYLEEVKLADERAGENLEGINEFVTGISLKIHLNMTDNSWQLDIYRNDGFIGIIFKNEPDEMAAQFSDVLSGKGYTENDTILCQLFYNATEGGTASAYRDIQRMLSEIKKEYTHFFLSETDISIFEEE